MIIPPTYYPLMIIPPTYYPHSTLVHASFVLVPILGITWVLGFFVVGDTTIASIIEWIFCIFTTLQGVMIFIMHCLLNRDVSY